MKTGTKYLIIVGLLMGVYICLAGCTGTGSSGKPEPSQPAGTADPITGTFEGNLASGFKCTVYFGSDNSYETFCNNVPKAYGTWKKTGPNQYEAAINGQTVSFNYYPDIDTLVFKSADIVETAAGLQTEKRSVFMYRPGKVPKL